MHAPASAFRRLVLAYGLTLALFATPSYAFSDDEARRAILELREQLRQMTEQNNRARLQLANQVQALQQEAMQLRNQLELVTSQQPGSAGPSQNPNNPAGVQADDPQEQAAFDAAIDQFRAAHYQQASQALTDFIARYPNSPLAPTALFYQGSSRYALKDFKGAISQMQVLVQAAPDNPRAPDALLVIAGSQIETNDRAGAKSTLQRLIRDYPNAESAGTAKDRLRLLQ